MFVLRESFKRLLDSRIEELKHRLNVAAKKHELALKSQIEFREKQLAEFYGPIYALLKRGRSVIYPYWSAGKLGAIDEQLRILAVESNNTIAGILLEKSHLIDGEKIPESFIHYLTHVSVWHAFLDAGHGGVSLAQDEFPEAYYPEEFQENIYLTTEKLKKELHDLHETYTLLG